MEQNILFRILGGLIVALIVIIGVGIGINNTHLFSASLLNAFSPGSGSGQNGKGGNSAQPAQGGFGRIVSVSGNTITVQGSVNTTFTVDASTAKITKGIGPNAAGISASDLKAGDSVQIQGNFSASASSVNSIVDNGGPDDHFSAIGKVTGISGDGFTIEQAAFGANGKAISYTIITTDKTQFIKDGKVSSLSAVQSNQNVVVLGALDRTSSTITADNVSVNTTIPSARNSIPPVPHIPPVPTPK